MTAVSYTTTGDVTIRSAFSGVHKFKTAAVYHRSVYHELGRMAARPNGSSRIAPMEHSTTIIPNLHYDAGLLCFLN